AIGEVRREGRTIARVLHVSRPEAGIGGPFHRNFQVSAKTLSSDSPIVGADDYIPIRELCVKMKGCADKGTDDRVPVRAVGMNAPQAPRQGIALALVLQAAEHHPAIAQHNGMQGTTNVQMTDRLHIAAVVVHDKQLQVDVEALRAY